jgi:2-phosphosulfolactate phosphatase
MEISIHSLLEGAKRATGWVAVIDVFRAFTTAAVALANGASSIVMVRTVEEALELRDAGIGQICMGEVRGRAPPGFDFGNSPFEISGVDFGGQTIIQRTSAGTQGIVAAKPSRSTLRDLVGHGRGDRPSYSLGITRSGLPRRDGGQWHQEDR